MYFHFGASDKESFLVPGSQEDRQPLLDTRPRVRARSDTQNDQIDRKANRHPQD